MNRLEIELELSRGRAEALAWVQQFDTAELSAPRTQSEHDPASWWSRADHFVHPALIEQTFNQMVRRHVRGERGMDPAMVDESGTRLRQRDDVMRYVHAFTEQWKVEHAGKPLDELVRISERVRADTLELLAELTDEQLASKIPGAPWADGTVGGVIAANGGHIRMHIGWADAGTGPTG